MTRCRAYHDAGTSLDAQGNKLVRERVRCARERNHPGPHRDDEGQAWDVLTGRQAQLLDDLRRRNGTYVSGVDVRVAKALARMRLVVVTDEGDLRPGGRSDGERWLAQPTGCWAPVADDRGAK